MRNNPKPMDDNPRSMSKARPETVAAAYRIANDKHAAKTREYQDLQAQTRAANAHVDNYQREHARTESAMYQAAQEFRDARDQFNLYGGNI